jgi:hypothetical protein
MDLAPGRYNSGQPKTGGSLPMPDNNTSLFLEGLQRVCTKLNRLGVFATVKTYGIKKMVDAYARGDQQGRALKIEVHTKRNQRGRFVTRITQRGFITQGKDGTLSVATHIPTDPDFWVLVHLPVRGETFEGSFFVLAHEEICNVQKAKNDEFQRKHIEKYGRPFNIPRDGVDGVTIRDVEQFRDKWSTIISDNRLTR